MNDKTKILDTSSGDDTISQSKIRMDSESSKGSTSSLEFTLSKENEERKFCQFKKIFVRSIHLFLVLFVTGNLFLQNTKLRDALVFRNYTYLIFFTGLTYTSLLFFFLTCFTNPGYVEKNTNESNKIIQHDGLPSIKLRFCNYCQIEQPIRSRHCEDCKKCVKKFDHHCPWLETCIGEKNHKYFWFFLGTTNALICWCIEITWSSFVSYSKWTTWLLHNLLFLFDAQVLVISFSMTLALFLIHTYFMITNTTTWEKFSRNNITYLKIFKNESYNPFHQSYFKNIYLFLFSPRDNRWENVYATFFKSKVKTPDQNSSNLSSENEVHIKIDRIKH